MIRDSPGLHLPRSYTRDALGRITRMVDERGFDWLATYNAADQCVQTRTPLVGAGATASRIGTTYFYDAGGLPSGCDVEHRDTTGALVAANPAYSTRYLRESPSRPRYVTRVAVENRPVSLPPGSTDLASAGVENFDVCDYTYNAAGDCVEERTPGVCLAQPTDIVTSYQFDERGLLYRFGMHVKPEKDRFAVTLFKPWEEFDGELEYRAGGLLKVSGDKLTICLALDPTKAKALPEDFNHAPNV